MPAQATPLFLVFDGAALDRLLFRIVERCPPTLDDFRSYEALGRAYDRRDFFKGTGVSMHTSRERAIAVARRYDLGRGVASLELRASPIVWARTGARGHVTVWAPPELLLEPWFNVTSMSKGRYTLLDRASRNFLGEFDTLAEAEETLARFLLHAPEAATDLEIWDDDEGVRVEVDPGTLRPAPAA